MGFNDRATSVSRKMRVRKLTENVYQPSQVSINRGVQAKRQKRLKVSLAAVNLPEESDASET